jgi:surface polysaccharide O-acyltransferase-like enzyme
LALNAAFNLDHHSEKEGQPVVQSTDSRPKRQWIDPVDYLKGFAILAVVAIHTSDKSIGYFHRLDVLVITNVVISVFCQFAVPLFVLLSGFVLTLRYERIDSLRLFYGKRMKAILPPYLVFSLAYLLLSALYGTAVTLRHAAFAIATASSEGHLWFIALIVQLYLLFPIAIVINDRLSAKWTLLFLVGALLVQSMWYVLRIVGLDSAPFQGPFPLDRVFASNLFYFVVGIVIGRRFESVRRAALLKSRFVWLAAAAVALLTALTSLSWITAFVTYGSYFNTPARHFLIPVLFEPVLYLCTGWLLLRVANYLARKRGHVIHFLSGLGRNSLGVYLIHYFYLVVLVSLVEHLNITSDDWIFFPIVFVLTVALSFASVKLLSYLPYSELLFGVHVRQRASMASAGG